MQKTEFKLIRIDFETYRGTGLARFPGRTVCAEIIPMEPYQVRHVVGAKSNYLITCLSRIKNGS